MITSIQHTNKEKHHEKSQPHTAQHRPPLGGERLSRAHRIQLPERGHQPFPSARLCRPGPLRAQRGAARRRLASTPRLRNGQHRLRGRGRARGLCRQPRPHRSGRRAVDDRGCGHPAQGNARPQLVRARRQFRAGAAVGEPARQIEDDGSRVSDAARWCNPGGKAGRWRTRAGDRGRVRRRQGAGEDVYADQPLGPALAGRRQRATAPARGPHLGAVRTQGQGLAERNPGGGRGGTRLVRA